MKDDKGSHPFDKPSKHEWFKDIEKYLKHNVKKDNLRVVKQDVVLDPFYTSEEVEAGQAIPKSLADIKPIKALNAGDNVTGQLEKGFQGVMLESDNLESINLADVNFEIADVITYGITQPTHKKVKHFTKHVHCKDHTLQNLKEGVASSQNLLVSFYPSEDFYRNIATLRAIHRILTQMEIRYKVVSVITAGDNEIGDKGLIEATYKVLAAVLGATDFVAFDTTDPNKERLYLNILWIMKYESGLLDVNDPVSGSYFIEEYTNQIINSF